MAQLMELLEKRRKNRTDEQFAVGLNLSGSTVYRYRKGKTEISMDAMQKMTPVFAKEGDSEIIGAFVAYALGIEDAPLDTLKRIGQSVIDAQSSPSK